MSETTRTEPHPKEVQKILQKARHYNMTATFDDDVEEGFTRLIIAGDRIDLFESRGTSWAPNVRIQGNAGPGKLAFMWSDKRLEEPKPADETKPANALPDEKVLEAIPQSQILTENRLREVLVKMNELIEAAYPGVQINDTGFGRGKRDLVFKVIDRIAELATRNIHRYHSMVVAGLLAHLQADGKVGALIEMPGVPVAIARR